MKHILQNIDQVIWNGWIIILCIMLSHTGFGQAEICNNGIDDDNDLLIDINDDDCRCQVFEPLSLIPNPSFEDRNCCPTDRSQLDCATDWIQASAPTTDFIHACDWLGWPQFPPPMPFPDGDGIMGFRDGRVRSSNNPEPFWKEYAGACLLSPLIADSSYRFQFDLGFVDDEQSPPIDISFFGTPSCDFLPFGGSDIAFGCPSNSPNWKKLGEIRVSGDNQNVWVNAAIDIVPEEDIYAIAIGPDCRAVDTPVSLYYYFDNLLLTNLEFFDLQISEVSHPCRADFSLSVPFNPDLEYQWYLGGVALVGETFSTLRQNYGEGSYQIRILDGQICRISADYEYVIPSYSSPLSVAICQGDVYRFGGVELSTSGMYESTLKTNNNCDSMVQLRLDVIGETYDTVEARIIEGGQFEIADVVFEDIGEYPLTLSSSLGCDSLVLLRLNHFTVFIPNAFSPNADGVNDAFYPVASEGLIQSVDMRIFDRWGNLMFEGSEWNGGEVEQNVYVYMINIDFENGQSKAYQGTVTVVK